MTMDDSPARGERVAAGLDESGPREREEHRARCRDAPRQMEALGRRIAGANGWFARLAEESRAGNPRLANRIARLAETFRAEDQRLQKRIGSLVSAVGRSRKR